MATAFLFFERGKGNSPLPPPPFGPNRWKLPEALGKLPTAWRKLPEALGKLRAKGGEIGDETRAPPLFPKLPQGFQKLPQGFWKLPEALRKTCGLLNLRGSGREGQGAGEGRGEHERWVSFSSACRAASRCGEPFGSKILQQCYNNNSSIKHVSRGGGGRGGLKESKPNKPQ